jgi:glycosyltransferase involved in cell wall biosynthesis
LGTPAPPREDAEDARPATVEPWVVVAAYNEAAVIEEVLAELVAAYPNVVVVDDGSEDDTAARAARHAPHVLRHLVNRGQGASLQTGIEYALRRGAGAIVTFDADGQHEVDDVAVLLEPIRSGACDITLGSRFLGEAIDISTARRLALKAAALFTFLVNGVRLTDAHNGMRAFSRRAAEQITITADRMAHASELIDNIKRTRLPFKEVPVRIRYTEYSRAKGQSLAGGFRILLHYVLARILG